MRTIPLTTLSGKERHPSFSPDGSRIAFVWDGEKGDNEDIYVKAIGTEVPFRLTASPARDGYPVWSPDGRQIAFVRATATGSELLVVPALGGPERRIYSRSSTLEHCSGMMSWSPDGQLLAIADREREQFTCSIFLLSLETLQKRKLTSPPDSAGADYAPAFSPDGHDIAFNRFSPAGGGIHVVAAAGGIPRRVTLDQYFWRERLAWLPTGRELLFSAQGGGRDPESSSSLWKVSASGGTPQRLGVGGDNAANPAVSPSGDRLAYEQRHLDANIWRIALPQSTRPTLAPLQLIASSRQDYAPHVSRDGARVAFLSDRSGDDEIWLCDTAGANVVQLTTSDGTFGTPQWSPDSRHLAAERNKGHPGIYVISAEGGLPRQVTTDPSASILASWSSDGRSIYFGSNRTGRFELWRVRAEGGPAVQVTTRGGYRGFESADGKFVYYVKAFYVAGVWRVPVNGGDETAVVDFPKVSFWGYWALTKDGIYFVDTEGSPQPALRYFHLGTGRVSHVMALPGKPIPRWPGMAVSPDGEWLLYTQMDHRGGDLMLVENFY